MSGMKAIEVFKALSNESRLQIMELLKDPKAHFHHESGVDMVKVGVCVGEIRRVTGLTQSTVSMYLSQMEKAGLLISTRIGKWTYYRRDEEAIARLAGYVRDEL
jgi:DNA-binding transcriptional ArsR family regulator